MGVLAWIVGLIVAVGFVVIGGGKLMGMAMMEESRQHLKVSDGLWKAIGGLEILGAIGVFIGLLSDGDAELLGTAAAIGLILLVIGALVYHRRAGDAVKDMAPAAMMLVLSVLYIVFLAAR